MTSSPQADLILLIRLLHDDLSPAEGIIVREKLADSLEFAERYRQVNAAIRQPASTAILLATSGQPDIDHVAMFVDDTLNPAEQAEFEATCWKTPTLLHEVIATWRGTRQPNAAINPRADFAGRMLDVVRTAAIADARVSHTATSVSETAAAVHSRHQRSRRSAAPWTTATWVFGAIAAVVMLIVASQFRQDAVDDVADENSGSRRANDTARIEPTPPAAADPPDEPLELIPNELPIVSDHPPMISDIDVVKLDPTLPGDDLPSDPTPPLPESLTQPSAVSVVGQWKDVRGVVAVRGSSRAAWHGIDSDSATAALGDSAEDEILTFANSLATAELSDGSRLSLGPETLVRIPVAVSSGYSGNSNDPSTGELELEYGRLAVLGLTNQQKMRMVAGGRVLEIRAEDSAAEFTIEQSLDRILCAIIRGTVSINDQRASAGNWLELDDRRVTNVPAGQRTAEWINGPASGHAVPASISDHLNRANNLHQESRALLNSQNPLASRFAARVLIELADVRDPDAIPEPFIRAGVESGAEVRRVALVQWTVSSMERRPDRTAEIWDAILRHSTGGNGRQNPAMNAAVRDELRNIYQAAIRRVDPDDNWLRRLAQQLQPSSHIFARQSAKYFLEQILNESLSEYDAANPTRQAINSVTQKLRRWRSP